VPCSQVEKWVGVFSDILLMRDIRDYSYRL